MKPRRLQWKALPALLRWKLSLAVAATALAGFVYVSHVFTWQALSAFVGVFLLAAAASALNQSQEINVDCLMERTRNRPLPSRQFTSCQAIFVVMVIGGAGLLLLFLTTTAVAAGLAAFTMILYNGLYTPLKRKTAYAVLVGALVGALAPMIGYCAAGGHITDGFIVVCLFMYLWQVSHFLLLLLKFRREYKQAGIPTLAFTMNMERFRITFFIWILATAGSALAFPLFHVISGAVLSAALIIANCLFVFYFHAAFIRGRKYFEPVSVMYLFQGFIFALLMAGAFIREISS